MQLFVSIFYTGAVKTKTDLKVRVYSLSDFHVQYLCSDFGRLQWAPLDSSTFWQHESVTLLENKNLPDVSLRLPLDCLPGTFSTDSLREKKDIRLGTGR